MGKKPTGEPTLPKPLKQLVLAAGVVAAVAAAIAGVVNLLPRRTLTVCAPLSGATDTTALHTLHESRPKHSSPNIPLWVEAKPASIVAVAIAASPDLQDLERRLKGEAPGAKDIYFVHAPGGSGKTPLVDYLRKKYGLAYVNLTKLNEDLEQGPSMWAERATELRIMGKDVSWQPMLKVGVLESGLEAFVSGVTGQSADFSKGLLVDSLDEVHPVSALALLKKIAEYSAAHPKRVIVVAGRGEAFREYMVRTGLRSVKETLVRLPNLYVGDDPLLTWYIADYVDFKTKGDKAVVPAEMAKELQDGLTRLTVNHPFTRHFLYPGALGNFALENVRYSDEGGQRLEALMFQALIERNKGTHHRPVQDDAAIWSVYKDALVQISRRYKPDVNGVFLVGPQDTVCVSDGQSRSLVNVGSILMRSGLVDLNPVNVQYFEFLFWPQTLHEFLAKGVLE